MHQRERISWYVMLGEMMESENLDECFTAFIGPTNITSKVERAYWLVKNVPALMLSEYFDFEYVRICSHCGKPMGWGYCLEGGCEYYCSSECLHHHFSDEEWENLYNHGNGDSYYTAWID